MINKKTARCGILATVLIASLCFIFFFIGKTNRIDSIENYENVFKSVSELQFYIYKNNFYGTKSPSKELKEIKKTKINLEPIATEESENRKYKYRIVINDEYIIYINDDFSQLWLDDKSSINVSFNNGIWDKTVDEGTEASLPYSIENPKVLKTLFEKYSQHIN